MTKNHPYSRLVFRRRWVEWVRRNTMIVSVLTLGMLFLIATTVGLLLFAMPASGFRSWLLGAMPTATLASYLHILHTAFLAHDAEAIRHVRGAWGEDNTRGELQRAKRKRLVWGWVDSLGLLHGDIDHFVVTRRGGLVVVDSKWRSQAGDVAEMSRAAQKVRLRAEALARDLLKGSTRGARRARVNPLSVTSVVVLWGNAQHTVPDGAIVDGIEFIAGRKFLSWLSQLDGQPVDKAAATSLLRAIEAKRVLTGDTSARIDPRRAR